MLSPEQRQQREAQRVAQALFRVRLSEALRGKTVVVWVVAAALLGLGAGLIGGDTLGLAEVADHVMLNGALMPARIVHGEWWRFVVGPLLHRDLSHLLVNVVGLLLIGRYVELAFGRSGFVSLYFGAAATGAMATMASGYAISIGASGAIFGLMGGLIAVGLRLWQRLSWRLKRALVGLPLVIVCGLLILGGVSDGAPDTTDIAAHVGGALGGLLLGLLLPLRLRDFERRPLGAATPRWLSRVWFLVALLLILTVAAALAEVARRSTHPPTVARPEVQQLRVGGATITVPTGYTSGVWRVNGAAGADTGAGAGIGGRCTGTLVDPAWTLAGHRVACFELPFGGTLLLGRPAQLATMDGRDHATMARAWRERRFVWRQPNVMIAPAGGGLLYVLYGHRAMLAGYAAALGDLLPPSGGGP